MAQEIELHTGGLNASPHVTPNLKDPNRSADKGSSASRFVHLSGYCLESKVPKFFELWSKLFSSPEWSDSERLTNLILMSATGDWSANAITHSGEMFMKFVICSHCFFPMKRNFPGNEVDQLSS